MVTTAHTRAHRAARLCARAGNTTPAAQRSPDARISAPSREGSQNFSGILWQTPKNGTCPTDGASQGTGSAFEVYRVPVAGVVRVHAGDGRAVRGIATGGNHRG